jgi:hypothetical protein
MSTGEVFVLVAAGVGVMLVATGAGAWLVAMCAATGSAGGVIVLIATGDDDTLVATGAGALLVAVRAASVTNFCKAMSEAELEEDEDDEARAEPVTVRFCTACAASCLLVIAFMPPNPFGVISIRSQLLSIISLWGLPERPAACTLYFDGSMDSCASSSAMVVPIGIQYFVVFD